MLIHIVLSMNQKFKTTVRLKFRETDPAGIMYFANIFSLAHDAFEEFIVATGFTWKEWFEPKQFAVPIRHAESDYVKPLKGGDEYEILVSVLAFGNTSFTVRYEFMSSGSLHATVKTVHSMLDIKKFTKVQIPADYRTRLEKYYVG